MVRALKMLDTAESKEDTEAVLVALEVLPDDKADSANDMD
jgi:hypothetical protein